MKNALLLITAFVITAGLLLSCGGGVTPTPTVSPTSTPSPTATPAPTRTAEPSPTPDPAEALLAKVDTSKHWNDLSGKIAQGDLDKLEDLSHGDVLVFGLFFDVSDEEKCGGIACIIYALGAKYGYDSSTSEPVVVMVVSVNPNGSFPAWCYWSVNPRIVPYGKIDGAPDQAESDTQIEMFISQLTLLQADYIGIDLPVKFPLPTVEDLTFDETYDNIVKDGQALLRKVNLRGALTSSLEIHATEGTTSSYVTLAWMDGKDTSGSIDLYPGNVYLINGELEVTVKAVAIIGNLAEIKISAKYVN